MFRKKAAIYCRLSAAESYETSSDTDSVSHQNLKASLTHYAKDNGWQIYDIYTDTGTVTTAMSQLCQDARAHLFDIVLCQSEQEFKEIENDEELLHTEFPNWGIRFIGISDLSDFKSIDPCMESDSCYREVRLHQLTDEWGLKELAESARKTMSRRKPVLRSASSIPFGYRSDTKTPDHIMLDKPASAIISTIFNMYAEGLSRGEIAICFNYAGVPSPDAYAMGKEYHSIMDDTTDLSWHESIILKLLTNEIYAGIHNSDLMISSMITEALWKCVQSRLVIAPPALVTT